MFDGEGAIMGAAVLLILGVVVSALIG